MRSNISVLVTPRDGVHYQDLLYRDIRASGVRVHYAEGPTPSQTINIFLAPVVLVWWRSRGYRILHIHWVFQFSLPWARRKNWARQLMQWWFGFYLRTARALGYKIVWTAHDLIPHEQVFEDDAHARDQLIREAKMIIALSDATAEELRSLGANRVRVIPMGSYSLPYPITLSTKEARESFGFSDEDVVVALIGRLERYKGADLLLLATAQLQSRSRIKILLAGTCSDETYRDELIHLAEKVKQKVIVEFQWIPDDDLARYYQATDIAAFPFREITNSASVLLAQSFGLPVVIPDLPTLRDIPSKGALRFEFDEGFAVERLVAALQQAESLTDSEYREMSSAALTWSTRNDWSKVASETTEVYREILLGSIRGPHRVM